jgi:hypothetical protein
MASPTGDIKVEKGKLKVASLREIFEVARAQIKDNELVAAEMTLKRCYDIAPNNPDVQQELFSLYKENVDKLRRSAYLDFPLFVSVETSTLCNASCSFCPYPGLERRGNRMPEELINKIICDLKDIPKDIEFRFAPFKVSDPFTEPRIFSIIENINRELPNAMIDLYSNGASLSEEKFSKLLQIKNFQYLNISLNEYRRDEYEKLMGLKFDHVMRRLTMIHERVQQGEVPFAVVVSRVSDYINDEDFRDFVADRFPLFHVHTHRRSDWLGQVDVQGHKVPDIGCAMWFSLSITSTGVAAYCCMDGEGQYPIGDVTKQHTLDVYNSPAFRAVREKQASRLGGIPCNRCTFF